MIRVKFINDAGTITYNQEAGALEILFDGSGNYQQHLKSLNIASDMAKMYSCASYLLSCHCFRKIKPIEFRTMFLRWMQELADNQDIEQSTGVSICLVVAHDAFDLIAEFFSEEGLLIYKDIVCYLFDSLESAYDFLQMKNS